MLIRSYLYRGTTEGWPGNKVLQEEQITCTTTDLLVAALFAIKGRNHGPAVILAAQGSLFAELVAPPNHFAVIESAVNLRIRPIQFAKQAEMVLNVDEVLEFLREIGFEIPVRLRDHEALREALLYTYEAGQRLNSDQLDLFNSRAFGAKS